MRNPVLVGIDPRAESLPRGFLGRFPATRAGVAEAFGVFGRGVVDVVAPLVPAVKFQAAFYEAYGPEGMGTLHDTVAYARRSGLIVIVDGKRNDIGSTAEAYADAYLGESEAGGRREAVWDADALTITPYLGRDGVEPFVRVAAGRDRGVFALVRTSNPSAGDFQDLISGAKPIYQHVAEKVASWGVGYRDESGYSLLGAVVGATYPAELAILRGLLPNVLFLVPGYGAQGGTAADVAPAFDADGFGALINNSRGLTFAYRRADLAGRFAADWQGAIAHAVGEMAEELASYTPSGRLRA